MVGTTRCFDDDGKIVCGDDIGGGIDDGSRREDDVRDAGSVLTYVV